MSGLSALNYWRKGRVRQNNGIWKVREPKRGTSASTVKDSRCVGYLKIVRFHLETERSGGVRLYLKRAFRNNARTGALNDKELQDICGLNWNLRKRYLKLLLLICHLECKWRLPSNWNIQRWVINRRKRDEHGCILLQREWILHILTHKWRLLQAELRDLLANLQLPGTTQDCLVE